MLLISGVWGTYMDLTVGTMLVELTILSFAVV